MLNTLSIFHLKWHTRTWQDLLSLAEPLHELDLESTSALYFRSLGPRLGATINSSLLELSTYWKAHCATVNLYPNLCSARRTPIQYRCPFGIHLYLRESLLPSSEAPIPSSLRELAPFVTEEVKLVRLTLSLSRSLLHALICLKKSPRYLATVSLSS